MLTGFQVQGSSRVGEHETVGVVIDSLEVAHQPVARRTCTQNAHQFAARLLNLKPFTPPPEARSASIFYEDTVCLHNDLPLSTQDLAFMLTDPVG